MLLINRRIKKHEFTKTIKKEIDKNKDNRKNDSLYEI